MFSYYKDGDTVLTKHVLNALSDMDDSKHRIWTQTHIMIHLYKIPRMRSHSKRKVSVSKDLGRSEAGKWNCYYTVLFYVRKTIRQHTVAALQLYATPISIKGAKSWHENFIRARL